MNHKRLLLTTLIGYFITFFVFGQSEIDANRYADAYKQYLDAACPFEKDNIKHFIYLARDRELMHDHAFLKVQRIEGAQIMYPWKQLEPERGQYDFSIIHEDYNYLLSHGKKIFIQLQDVTFNPKVTATPDYLMTDEFDGGSIEQYHNGKVNGWVAKRWNTQVQQRWALLMKALGKEFDGKVEGINLQESAIEVSNETDSTFTPERYLESLKNNMRTLKVAFPKSTTMQYANFMPGEWLPWEDKGYLRSLYQYGQKIGVGLGGPDLMVQRTGQLNHTITMMHEHDYSVSIGIAVQDGNYVGQTGADKDYIEDVDAKRESNVPLLYAFAKDFLHVNYMFWVHQEPYFSEDVIPCLSND